MKYVISIYKRKTIHRICQKNETYIYILKVSKLIQSNRKYELSSIMFFYRMFHFNKNNGFNFF